MNFLGSVLWGAPNSGKQTPKPQTFSPKRHFMDAARTSASFPSSPPSHKFLHHSVKNLPRNSRQASRIKQAVAPPLQTILEERESAFQTSNNSTNNKILTVKSMKMQPDKTQKENMALTTMPIIREEPHGGHSLPLALGNSTASNSRTATQLQYSKSQRQSSNSKQCEDLILSLKTTSCVGKSSTSLADAKASNPPTQFFNIDYERLRNADQVKSSGCCMCIGNQSEGWHSTPQEYHHFRGPSSAIPSVAVAPAS